ncbi:MAG: hypothetical protein AAGA95_08275 [Pseudomonadota bacterium]
MTTDPVNQRQRSWRWQTPSPRHTLVPGLAFCCVVLLASCGDTRSVAFGPGVMAAAPPEQLSISAEPLILGDVALIPRAEFAVTAKVLAKRRYRWDEMADAARWDFALGWGMLSDEAVLDGTKVLQGDRLMYWHLYGKPLDLQTVERSSANVHLIGETPDIEKQFAAVPRGAIVTMQGRLVDIRFADNRVIPTSLTRDDTGVGACEILLVSSIQWRRPV